MTSRAHRGGVLACAVAARARRRRTAAWTAKITSGRDQAGESWLVVDDWPEQVPVSRAEVEILETLLGPRLDEILGGEHAVK